MKLFLELILPTAVLLLGLGATFGNRILILAGTVVAGVVFLWVLINGIQIS